MGTFSRLLSGSFLPGARKATVKAQWQGIDYYQREPVKSLLVDLALGRNRMAEAEALPAGERAFILDRLSHDNCPVPTAALMAWHRELQSGYTAAAVAQALVRDAWAARGRKLASQTSQASFRSFFELLDEARSFTDRVASQWPGEPGILFAQLTICRGTQQPRPTLDALVARVREVDPWDFAAAQAHLQYVCAKWFGSNEEAITVARSYQAAPEGSAVRGLIAAAQIEASLNVARSAIPTELSDAEREELARELGILTQAVGRDPQPDQLLAIALLVHCLEPQTTEQGQVVLRGLEAMAGRRPEITNFKVASPSALWEKVIRDRTSQARAVGAR